MAMIASQPLRSSQAASSTVVALDSTLAPLAFTRCSSSACGRPKWKLTTSGRNASTSRQLCSSKGARFDTGVGAVKSAPTSL
ncbi:hypothetical protein D3C80_2077830 [compost metagenome]